MAIKTTNQTLQEFCRWFRGSVRDPLLKAAMVNPKIKSFLTVDLPQRLFEAIQRWEQNTRMTGSIKATSLRQEVYTWLNAHGWKVLLPFIVPLIEKSVLWIYRGYFMAKFKALGLHEQLELMLNDDLDNDGDVGVANVVPKMPSAVVTVPVMPEDDPVPPEPVIPPVVHHVSRGNKQTIK